MVKKKMLQSLIALVGVGIIMSSLSKANVAKLLYSSLKNTKKGLRNMRKLNWGGGDLSMHDI